MHLRVVIAPLALALSALACSNRDPVAPESATLLGRRIVVTAESHVEQASLEWGKTQFVRTRVTLRNVSSSPALVEYGGCVVQLRAHRDPDRLPVWNQEGTLACVGILVRETLAPGESMVLEAGARSADILGSRPAGTFHITARVRLVGAETVVAAGVVQIAHTR